MLLAVGRLNQYESEYIESEEKEENCEGCFVSESCLGLGHE